MNDTTIYSYEEAFDSSLNYFDGDDLAANVFLSKYALRDKKNNILEKNPSDMHRRIAKELARIEKSKFKNPYTEDFIFSLLDKFKYIVPQGSPMFGIGNNYQIVSLSNCYVIEPPLDTYSSILRTDHDMAQISKRRGGVGTDISHIRPAGVSVNNAARSSTGIIGYMERYSNTIREVGQSGRRGALMLTIDVHHPESVIPLYPDKIEQVIVKGDGKTVRDIITTNEFYDPNNLDFCTIKFDRTKVTGANISIRLSQEFFDALEKNGDFEQRWPVDAREKGQEPVVSKMVNARKIWNKIIHSAWQTAEPGIIAWNNIINYNAVDCYSKFGFKTVSTNPCAELPICAEDSCRLLLQNLFSYVKNPFTDQAEFDFELFFEHAKIAQRLMDDVIDLEIEKIDQILNKIDSDPEPDDVKNSERVLWKKIRDKCINGRRTGTGITAEGDTLAALGLKYSSDESIAVVDKIHQTQKLGSFWSSVEMAKEIGPFPIWNWELEKNSQFLLQIKKEDENLYENIKKYGRRNIANLTIAPTGSVSILTQTTGGIEPLYSLTPYTRKKKINPGDNNTKVDFIDQNGDKWQKFTVYHPKVKMWMDVTGNTDLSKSPWHGCCAEDLDWKQRVKLQSVAQKHIDHAISSTINLPADVKEEKVAEIYEHAFKLGCKGMTVYRDGCRSGVLTKEEEKVSIKKTNAPKRPQKLECDIHHTKSRGEDFFVLVGLIDGNPYEIFAGKNGCITSAKKGVLTKKKRGEYTLDADDGSSVQNVCDLLTDEQAVITRMISLSLRHGSDVSFIVDQLEKSPGDMTNFGKALARVLKKYILNGTKVTGMNCSNCGSSDVVRLEGCNTCQSCGNSKCG